MSYALLAWGIDLAIATTGNFSIPDQVVVLDRAPRKESSN